MASISLPLQLNSTNGEHKHCTLIHFELMDREKFIAINGILKELMNLAKTPPVGVWGAAEKVGRFNNVPARMVTSAYVTAIQGWLQQQFDAAGVAYSNDFENRLHVSRPYAWWAEGEEIPFQAYVEFRWSQQNAIIGYELGQA